MEPSGEREVGRAKRDFIPGIGVFSLDMRTRRIAADPYAAALFGFADDVPGRFDDWLQRISPQSRPTLDEALSAMPPGGAAEFEYSLALPRERWLHCRVFHDEGEVKGVLTDVTRHRRAIEGLALRETPLRRAVEVAPLPVIIHAEDGRILYVSDTLLEVTGYRRDELRTIAEWTRLAYGERADEVMAHVHALFSPGRVGGGNERDVRTAGGETLRWRFRTSLIGRDAAGLRLAITMAHDLTEQRRREERMRLLMREVNHRAKNVLAKVQAIVRISQKTDPEHFVEDLEARIVSLARVHSLIDSSQSGVSLSQILRSEMAALATPGQWTISGPDVLVEDAEAAQGIGMILQELITNAAKYGALRAEGSIGVEWTLDPTARSLRFSWKECLPAPLPSPGRQGFGSVLLDITIRQLLRGTLDMRWEKTGLQCEITLPDHWFRQLSAAV
jgi:PAS domain S-box-containing protein